MANKGRNRMAVLHDHANLEQELWYGNDVLLARILRDNIPLDQLSNMSAYAVTLLEKGSLTVNIDFQKREISSPTFLLISPNTMYECVDNSFDCAGKVIAVSPAFAENIRAYTQTVFSAFSMKTCGSLSDEELNTFESYFQLVYQLVKLEKNPVNDILLRDVIQSLFNYLSVVFERGLDNVSRKGKHFRDEEICHTFMMLVKQFASSERNVEEYAERMRISPKYLTAIVKRVTGRTASDWIRREVILQAKKLLTGSSLTVQQVSDQLHFHNQSHFGTYFKRVEGVSPQSWRRDRR